MHPEFGLRVVFRAQFEDVGDLALKKAAVEWWVGDFHHTFRVFHFRHLYSTSSKLECSTMWSTKTDYMSTLEIDKISSASRSIYCEAQAVRFRASVCFSNGS
jgi:hypothetical protein